MKYIITEEQLEKVKDKILKVSFQVFANDWNALQEFLNRRGNPPYIITDDVNLLENKEITTLGNLISVGGNLDLYRTKIKYLENLTSVGGYLDLRGTPIKSLGNLTSVGGYLGLSNTPIQSLGNLTSVDGNLNLRGTSIQSLGNLKSVGVELDLYETPISKKYSRKEIRRMVKVGANLYI